MAIYRWDDRSKNLKTAKLFNAAGEEIRHVVVCDTETGYVERVAMNGDVMLCDKETGKPKILKEHRLAPLRIEWDRE